MKRLLALLALLLVAMGCTFPPQPASITRVYRSYLPMIQVASTHDGIAVQIEGASLNGREIYLAPGSLVKVSANWNQIERVRGVYTWPPILDGLGEYKLIVSVKSAPPWARRGGPTALECYGVDPRAYSSLASFLGLLGARYPNITAIELWNEPDTAITQMPPQDAPFYGCIGDGRVYAEMVCTVYPILKQARPGITRIAGAMGEPLGGNFLANFANACSEYDVFSFHQYEWSGVTNYEATNQAATIARITGKPVWLSETSLRSATCDAAFEQNQLRYMAWLTEQPIPKIVFYNLADNGWYCTDLCWHGICRPAWMIYYNSWR